MNEPLIRPAADRDAPEILRVVHAAFEEYRGSLDPPSGAHRETAGSIREKLAAGGAAVAVLASRIVGCVLWKQEPAHLYVGRLAVLPEFRRGGIGRQLLDWTEAHAHELGFRKVQLMVRNAVRGLKEYYVRRGYTVTAEGTHPGYDHPTYFVMEKELR